LEAALAIADELNESMAGYMVERAMDIIRDGDIDRLRERPR
jgi:hypothetical protein